jgi:hypothetical protein
LSDIRPLQKEKEVFEKDFNYQRTVLVLPPEPQALEDWHQRILTTMPLSNEWSLFGGLGRVLGSKFYENSPVPRPDKCQKRHSPNNNTEVHDCWG